MLTYARCSASLQRFEHYFYCLHVRQVSFRLVLSNPDEASIIMRSQYITTALATLLSATFAQVNFDATPRCSRIQIIAACGTYQSGYGTLEPLVDSMKAAIPGSASVALEYPAASNAQISYRDSVQSGVMNMTRYIEYFVDGCPNTQLLLVGYSQGAQVSLTSMCGWDRSADTTVAFPSSDPLPQKYSDAIIGVVSFGDPTHNVPTAFNRGTSTHAGIFPRTPHECGPYKNKIASWCNAGDTFCDDCPVAGAGQSNPRGCDPNVHLEYPQTDSGHAMNFVLSIVANAPTATTLPTATSVMGRSTTMPASVAAPTAPGTSMITGTATVVASADSTRTSTASATDSAATRLAPPGFMFPFRVLGLIR